MLRILPFLIGAASILLGPFFALLFSAQRTMASVTLMSDFDDLRAAKVLTIDDARLNEFQNGRLRSSDPKDWTRIPTFLASGLEYRLRTEHAVAATCVVNGLLWIGFGVAFVKTSRNGSRRTPTNGSDVAG